MGIFGKIEQAARYTHKVAGMAVEIGRLKLKIKRKNEEIRREKEKIGDIMWEKYNSNEQIPVEVTERCDVISDHFAAIEILANAIDAVKTQTQEEDCEFGQTCPDCGVVEDCCANYCSNCGAKLCEQSCCCEDDCSCDESSEQSSEE